MIGNCMGRTDEQYP